MSQARNPKPILGLLDEFRKYARSPFVSTQVPAAFAVELALHIVALQKDIEALRNAGTVPDPRSFGVTDDVLQKRADFNRDHAATLFPELVYSAAGKEGRWMAPIRGAIQDGYEPVVFTPYGYLRKSQLPA